MGKIIVYLDDLDFAKQQLAPTRSDTAATSDSTHWILVACPPRMTRHISKWVSYSARENWRAKWADKLFAQIAPELSAHGDKVTCVLSSGSLIEQTQELISRFGSGQVIDARRPKFGHDLQPVAPDQPATKQNLWSVPSALAGIGTALVFAAE